MIYQAVPADELLTQGDVIDDCPIYRTMVDGEGGRQFARVVVLTQACDLAQTKADQVVVASVVPGPCSWSRAYYTLRGQE
ncbi:MAG TPA: hypothetical protein VMZ71_05700 [Gemmataceae bacterium]|nr:hypothetical protein [Gemmataceae bacterium]